MHRYIATARAVAQHHGFSAVDTAFFEVISPLAYQGYGGCQVPELTVDITPAGKPQVISDVGALHLSMFAAGLLAWKTNKGWIKTPECKNPATGRRLDGFLWMTQACVAKFAPALFEITVLDAMKTGRAAQHPTTLGKFTADLLAAAAP
jgi:hypothetical protein